MTGKRGHGLISGGESKFIITACEDHEVDSDCFYSETVLKNEAWVIPCKHKWLKRCINAEAHQTEFYNKALQ